VVPAYEEGEDIISGLLVLNASIGEDSEIIVVVDAKEDSTARPVLELSKEYSRIKLLVSSYGRGPSNAIRYGFDQALGDVVVVMMADGCDDPRQVEDLANLIRRGVAVAAASRYMPGGQQVGGPRIKGMLSRLAGRSFAFFSGVGTRDATNSFKAYSAKFVRQVGIHSRDGFEVGIELTAKAKRLGYPVAEIPTTWIDRSFGKSNFRVIKWLPRYIYWFLYGLGFPHLDPNTRKLLKVKE
jgi:glycosyltransferase involved in cell wall biosynthesis